MIQTINLKAHGQLISWQMDLDPDFPTDKNILDHMDHSVCYESDVAWALIHCLKPGDVAIDGGANVGFFSLLMNKLVGPSGLVIAHEPDKRNFIKLCSNIAIDHTSAGIIRDNRLLGECEQDDVVFFPSADDSGGSSMWDPARWAANVKSQTHPLAVEKVRMTTLDETAIGTVHRTKLIKLDVEGAELMALQGAEELLANHIPYVICEMNPFALDQMGASIREIRDFMQDRGRVMFLLNRDGMIPTFIPNKTELNSPHISNVLFSTFTAVQQAWPRAYG